MSCAASSIPVSVVTKDLEHTVSVWGRSVTFGADGMPCSMVSQGIELLAAPMRFVGVEDGEPMVWDRNYPDNESESFIQKRSEESVTICGAMRSERFIVDSVFRMEDDGCIFCDFKLMPAGLTVAQVFKQAAVKPLRYQVDQLWLEIPLRREVARGYSMFPNGAVTLSDGTTLPETTTSNSGKVPAADMAMSYKGLFWLGSDECGFGLGLENDRNWQAVAENHQIELVHDGDVLILRLRLLDSQPVSWSGDPNGWGGCFRPVSFRCCFQTTPVKPFPRRPYLSNTLHLDCFVKIKGNYWDFLSAENRFDRLQEKGVTTLILHEKWNKCQNWFELSEYTEWQIKKIVAECHRRGIKVLTYFGYEISALADIWTDHSDRVVKQSLDGKVMGGWYRVPYQRDLIVCYNTDWADRFVNGIAQIMDRCHTDGVYLDGTANPHFCANEAHGCGWRDADGKLHGSYALGAVRELFKKLHAVMKPRGGMVNVHGFGCMNFMALPYIDLTWYGENLQQDFRKGDFRHVPLDYFQAEYTGRNMGVPVEFLAYENLPVWTFENALALSSIHGILPRPNDIEHPLDVMSEVWSVVDRFPIEQSTWHPYWTNGVKVSDPKVKVSYYRYVDVTGKVSLLAFCGNMSPEPTLGVQIDFPEKVARCTEVPSQVDCPGALDFKPFTCRILYLS